MAMSIAQWRRRRVIMGFFSNKAQADKAAARRKVRQNVETARTARKMQAAEKADKAKAKKK